MERFSYNINMQSDLLIVHLNGYIDTTTVNKFKEIFEEIKDINIKEIYFDFSKVDYVSSSGWGVFISNSIKLKEKGVKVLAGNMHDAVKRIYDLMDLKRFINYEERIFEPQKEKEREEVKKEDIELKIKPLIKNLIVENPFLEEEEIKKLCEKKLKQKINMEHLRNILVQMDLETREKRFIFAYNVLKKLIKGKK